jgi:peptide/nickel transport system permease protein
MGFAEFVFRRLVLMLLVLLGITLITFVLSHVVPTDPLAAYVGPQTPQAQVDKIRHEFGLDKPLPEQYVIYMSDLAHGDLGTSIHDNRPVADDLRTYFPATLELTIGAMLIAIVIGVPAGVVAAVRKDSLVDHLTRVFSLTGVSLPVFFLALLLLAVLYVKLGVLPGPGELGPYTQPPPRVTGMTVVDSLLAGDLNAFQDALSHLFLPSFVLGFATTGIILRITRSTMVEVLRQDYVRTARAKGLSQRRVVVVHALRNALIPTVTVIGLAFGSLLSGAVLTETIFSWPGLGRYATDAVVTLDIPAIMGVTIVAAVAYSLINLLVDIAYGWLDPRITFG